jgi:hypothetical protein
MARRKRRGRTVMVATSLLAAGCNAPTEKPVAVEATPVERAPSATDAIAVLARDAVTHDRFARRTLYTWTTGDQIDELRRSRQLLVRSESPARGATYVEQVLHALAERGDAVATLLDTTTYARSRFAWPSPWATRGGWPGEDYGDHLIRVTLKPDAVVLALSTSTAAFVARDLDNVAVPLADVIAHPERIAAIYFVSDGAAGSRNLPLTGSVYREYVLCNEAMIAGWSVGTDEIAHELDVEARTLETLVRYVQSSPAPRAFITRTAWAAVDRRDNRPERAFAAALALDSVRYRLDRDSLAALARMLRDTPKPAAFEGGGTATFPGIGPRRSTPRVVPVARGSYGGTFGSYGGTYVTRPRHRP